MKDRVQSWGKQAASLRGQLLPQRPRESGLLPKEGSVRSLVFCANALRVRRSDRQLLVLLVQQPLETAHDPGRIDIFSSSRPRSGGSRRARGPVRAKVHRPRCVFVVSQNSAWAAKAYWSTSKAVVGCTEALLTGYKTCTYIHVYIRISVQFRYLQLSLRLR